MRKLSPREFEEFSQDQTGKKWKMGIGLAAKPVQFPVSHHLTKRSENSFSRNLHEGGKSNRVRMLALPPGQSLRISCSGVSFDEAYFAFFFS